MAIRFEENWPIFAENHHRTYIDRGSVHWRRYDRIWCHWGWKQSNGCFRTGTLAAYFGVYIIITTTKQFENKQIHSACFFSSFSS